jgi:hypothetical protein
VRSPVRQIGVRIVGGIPASPTGRTVDSGSSADSTRERAAQQSERWTCTYQSPNQVRASAAFGSAPEALDFAEQHAQLMGVQRGEWHREGDTWLLATPIGDYLVREQSE